MGISYERYSRSYYLVRSMKIKNISVGIWYPNPKGSLFHFYERLQGYKNPSRGSSCGMTFIEFGEDLTSYEEENPKGPPILSIFCKSCLRYVRRELAKEYPYILFGRPLVPVQGSTNVEHPRKTEQVSEV